jgi:hypothetical protein
MLVIMHVGKNVPSMETTVQNKCEFVAFFGLKVNSSLQTEEMSILEKG